MLFNLIHNIEKVTLHKFLENNSVLRRIIRQFLTCFLVVKLILGLSLLFVLYTFKLADHISSDGMVSSIRLQDDPFER